MPGRRSRTFGAALSLTVSLALLSGNAEADEPLPSITIGDAQTTEGGSATFPVTLSAAATEEVTVTVTTVDGSARAPEDYASVTRALSFAPGETATSFTVATAQDALDEDAEIFHSNLSAPSANATISDGSGVGTIDDDDEPPAASIASADPDGVVEGQAARFVLSLSAPSGRDVTVPYRTVNGTAQGGVDYEPKPPGSGLVLAAGATSGEITVATIDDDDVESDETFSVVLGDPSPALRIGSPDQAVVTIRDDEELRAISVEGGRVKEGDDGTAELVFTLRLSGASARPVLVTASTADGTARAPADYQVATERVSFAPGVTQRPFVVRVNGDGVDELDESVEVVLSDPEGATVAVAQASGTITDDDATSKLAVGDTIADEPSVGTAPLRFVISLSPASERPVKVNWTTADGTGVAGSDYVAATGQLEFAPGQTSLAVDVSVLADSLNEDNETVQLRLDPDSLVGAGISDGTGQGTIVDKSARPSLSVDDVQAREGDGAEFTISLAGKTARAVTVTVETVDGSAKAGLDYIPRRTSLTFQPGESTKAFAVTVLDDAESEGIETFTLALGNVVNASVTKSRGTATIEASDMRATTPSPPSPAQPPVATPVGVLLPRLILGPRTVKVGGDGVARMHVSCQKASPVTCTGTVELERAAKPPQKLGRAAFVAKQGTKRVASIKLTARARALLERQRTLRARVIVLVKAGGKTMRFMPGTVTLVSTKPKPAPRGLAP